MFSRNPGFSGSAQCGGELLLLGGGGSARLGEFFDQTGPSSRKILELGG